tara:strand:- start:179 stop:445 length:267 start_codon:yes stop_codon:yes gene_type:complete
MATKLTLMTPELFAELELITFRAKNNMPILSICDTCNKDVEIGNKYYIWTLYINDKEYEKFMNGRAIMRYRCEKCGQNNKGISNGLTL